jgi:Asp-tRNA(Asn)/Glu-tRNA(Gln) amidotransferase A subunit family amidase
VSTALLPKPAVAAESFNLQEVTITSIHEAFYSGLLTSQKLVQRYLNRINAYDQLLNSIISLNPNALAEAWCTQYHNPLISAFLTSKSFGPS